MQRHDFDPIAFIFGVVFTGLGVLFMIGRLGLLNHAQWVWPGLLVLLGLAVLVGARGRGGARAARPAFESRSGAGVDPELEDDLLHSPVRTVDSEQLADSDTLFTLQPRTGAPAAGAAPPREEPKEAEAPEGPGEPDRTPGEPVAAARPEGPGETNESPTEVLPEVDPEADTTILPRPEAKED